MHWDFGNNTVCFQQELFAFDQRLPPSAELKCNGGAAVVQMLVPSGERPDCVASIMYLNHVEDGGQLLLRSCRSFSLASAPPLGDDSTMFRSCLRWGDRDCAVPPLAAGRHAGRVRGWVGTD